MRKIFYAIVFFAAAMSASAQTDERANEPANYTLEVQDFIELNIVDGIRVDYRALPDSAGWVSFTATPETASKIMFSNNRKKLTIQTSALDHPYENMPVVRVYSTILSNVTNTGDSLTRVLSAAPVEKMKIKVMGNGSIEADGVKADQIEASVDTGCGNVTVTGSARKAKLRNVGTGTVDASGLTADEARVFVFGPGPVDCDVREKLTVYGMGKGRVLLHGEPARITNRSIGVKVEQHQAHDAAEGPQE